MYRALYTTPDGQSAIFFLLFGLLTVGVGQQYEFGSPSEMGPGFFPVILGTLLLAVGLIMGAQALRASADAGLGMAAVEWRSLCAITAALVLSALTLTTLGLVVAIPLLTVVGSLASRNVRLVPAVATAAVLTVMAGAIFVLGLGLRIPLWWG